MIDIDKIEAAAKAAPYEASWRYEPTGQTVWAGNTYMVADIRGWGYLQHLPNGEALQDATGVHIATANPATVLEMVSMIRERDQIASALADFTCRLGEETAKRKAAQIENEALKDKVARSGIDQRRAVYEATKERDAVLRQALEILQDNRDDVARVERSQYMRDYYDPSIAAIKGVLNERSD